MSRVKDKEFTLIENPLLIFQASIKLEEQVRRYIETVKRTTEDKMSVAILQSRENRQQQQQQPFFH